MKAFGFLVVALVAVDISKIVEAERNVGVIRIEQYLFDVKCSLMQRLCIGIPPQHI